MTATAKQPGDGPCRRKEGSCQEWEEIIPRPFMKTSVWLHNNIIFSFPARVFYAESYIYAVIFAIC